MRLLNVKTLKLEDFLSIKKRPKYAILSHTWLEEEVLFHHINNLERPALDELKGFAKVKDSCARAQADGYDYIWIDTCCIDKSSSAELSEAINSMFTWYRQSAICYGFLADVKGNDTKSLYKSRWFKRGWTLQELIAPDNFIFVSVTLFKEMGHAVTNFEALEAAPKSKNVDRSQYDMKWQELGRRERMANLVSNITGIDENILSRNLKTNHAHDIQPRNSLCAVCGLPESIDEILRNISVASKMSWSAKRETTRGEDRSYSLLGLFGVNMPLLYGEGEAAAWKRLLDEVIKKSNDQSVFAFDYSAEAGYEYTSTGMSVVPSGGGIYAQNARRYTKNIQLPSSRPSRTMGFIAGDLVLEIWLCPLIPKDPSKWTVRKTYRDTFAGLLECKVIGDSLAWPVILVKPIAGSDNKFIRMPSNLLKVDMQGPPTFKACREPKRGETIRLGGIADDCEFGHTLYNPNA
ncbi:heterokaryon incompatibility protein-domain-containing protein [Xylaria cubensis]|nr:heterokaryon incompatibility protein-domain-containing protein [Xylaria cubensis]